MCTMLTTDIGTKGQTRSANRILIAMCMCVCAIPTLMHQTAIISIGTNRGAGLTPP